MRTPARLAAAAVALTCAAATTACTDDPPPQPGPATLAWQEITLPAPPPGERIRLGAATVCADRWYLVGAYGVGDDTRPAAWTSADGQTWTEQPVHAFSYYGVRSLLHAVACRDGEVVAVGGKVGGAHGNPRISSYHLVPGPDGTEVLTEVAASFELYGGPNATNVGRLTAGPAAFLMVGNRASGAAVWHSTDGSEFTIVEGAPILSSTPELATWAADAAYLDGAWIVVGASVTAGRADRDAAAWRSLDGRAWTTMPSQTTPAYDELNVVAPADGTLIAVGMDAEAFRTWRLGPDGWRLDGRFGSTAVEPVDGRLSSAIPIALEATGSTLFALVKVGLEFHLWRSLDAGRSWQPVTHPMAPIPAAGGQTATVVGVAGTGDRPDQVLLIVDDRTEAHAFLAPADSLSGTSG